MFLIPCAAQPTHLRTENILAGVVGSCPRWCDNLTGGKLCRGVGVNSDSPRILYVAPAHLAMEWGRGEIATGRSQLLEPLTGKSLMLWNSHVNTVSLRILLDFRLASAWDLAGSVDYAIVRDPCTRSHAMPRDPSGYCCSCGVATT